MLNFREIPVSELNIHPYTAIAKEWMLITAGNEERGYNTMTASWGHLGSIWGHGGGLPTSVIFIRPQRFTKEFVDREEYYTLSFFGPEYKKALGYLGSHSGRDGDKVAAVELTPVFQAPPVGGGFPGQIWAGGWLPQAGPERYVRG